MNAPDPKQLELEQEAVGKAILLVVMACAFLYFGEYGMAIFCCLIGIGWVFMSNMKPEPR